MRAHSKVALLARSDHTAGTVRIYSMGVSSMNSISFLVSVDAREGDVVGLLTAAISPVEGFHGVFSDSGEVVGDIGGRFAGVVWGKLGPAGVVYCEVGGLGGEYL